MKLPDFDQTIRVLRSEMDQYPVSPQHFVADSALFGLAIDVLEHSLAVQILRTSGAPRAAYANARAAFEAGQDAVYLTADPGRYYSRVASG